MKKIPNKKVWLKAVHKSHNAEVQIFETDLYPEKNVEEMAENYKRGNRFWDYFPLSEKEILLQKLKKL